jgi:hypothetical protein
MAFTKEQKQACADLCGISMASVNKYTCELNFDATNPNEFKIQYLEHKQRGRRVVKDAEHLAADKTRAIELSKKEKVLRKKAELDLALKEGSSINLAESEAVSAHLGLLIKTHLEALPRTSSIMLEGKTAKEIEKVLESKVREILFQLSTVKK